MTSTTPPVATSRDIAYLIEQINEVREYANEIGCKLGFVAVHNVNPRTLDAVVADLYREHPLHVKTVDPDPLWPDGYRSARIPTNTVLFSPGLSA